ncbi:thioredoxin TrxC [Algibacillus agarilyticus]|uniref:thioredoxin TrxC n=1 Tax=Algibacillus agarilyticus TaxID=2234133 RepID=UPI000DCF8AD7|nr:thioredoxin TrxC [Algibacillus agarilyticus]
MNIVCASCFTTNRIPDDRDHALAKCGKCQKGVYSAKPVALSDTTFYPFIERNDLPIVIDFWASWCGPCQNMAPIFERVSTESSQLLFAKVNTEQAQKISADAGIRSIPTLIFFYKGQEIDRVSGGLAEPQMKQWLMQAYNKMDS